jgi:8-oxo-dGTP pyrophosphatase MutT (NUDIX family)
MYSLFFNNRRIIIYSNNEPKERDQQTIKHLIEDPSTVHFFPGNDQKIEELPFIFNNLTNIKQLMISSKDQEDTFNKLCKNLTKITAGGGLVTNNKGELLLILRNELWDLPKGKQEEGENIETTALREVEEECGIKNLQIKEKICEIYHTYLNSENNLTVKCTHWFHMEYQGKETQTIPQREENIEQIVWIKPSELPKYLNNTYESIKELFANATTQLANH